MPISYMRSLQPGATPAGTVGTMRDQSDRMVMMAIRRCLAMAAPNIPIGRKSRLSRPLAAGGILLALLAGSPMVAHGLAALDDDELTGITGEGLTFAWTDFRMLSNPTSYLEQLGSDESDGLSCTTASPAEPAGCRRRGDLRWYGMSVSATGTALGLGVGAGAWNTSWTTTSGNMTQCTDAGYNGLGCPRGGPIALFAAHDNPYVLRVFDYGGNGTTAAATRTQIGNGIVTYEGNRTPGAWVPGTASNETTNGSSQTVLEWLAPTSQDYYRFAFWGEIESGRDLTTGASGKGLLKSQTIVQGNAAGSVLRFFKFTQNTRSPGLTSWDPIGGAPSCTDSGCASVDTAGTAFNNQTLALVYESYLQGDFRFSVAQTEATPVQGTPVVFHSREGLHFRNVRAFFPLGQSFYQALTLDVPRNASTNAPVTNGNFKLEIPLLPNRTAVFTRFYSLLTSSDGVAASAVPSTWDYGYATARSALLSITPGANTTGYPAVNPNYWKTHGYSRWGNWFPCQGVGCPNPPTAVPAARNLYNASDDGIFFGNIAAYNAFAYRVNTIDVRTGDRIGYGTTTVQDYADFGACTAAATGNNRWLCGYGGSYAAGTAAANSSSTLYHPAHYYLYDINGTEQPGLATRTVVPIAANGVLNIGDSRVEGMQINFMRFTSYGAQY